MSQSRPKPTTDDEWTIHVLNIHGTFFERWCEQSIRDIPGFTVVSTNYPVEFPKEEGGVRGKESALDIRAEYRDYNRLLTLIIECKKNNPDFVNWIFFPSQRPQHTHRVKVPIIINKSLQDNPVGWEVETDRTRFYISNLPFTDEARETKGAYQSMPNDKSKTKTSNAAVTEAAYQVALATQAVFLEEIEHSTKRSKKTDSIIPMRWNRQILLPVIITSAHLLTCDFDPKDVDPGTGEIPFDKAQLTEYPYLAFTYPLPRHLQYIPEKAADALEPYQLEQFMRMQMIVVHSANLAQFFDTLMCSADSFFL